MRAHRGAARGAGARAAAVRAAAGGAAAPLAPGARAAAGGAAAAGRGAGALCSKYQLLRLQFILLMLCCVYILLVFRVFLVSNSI